MHTHAVAGTNRHALGFWRDPMRFLPLPSKQVDCAPFMNGLRAVVLAVGMMLVAPRGASAQACMCAEQSRDAIGGALSGLELPLSAIDQLESHDELVGKLALAAPADSEDLPWCTSQNDARCSKRPAGSVPSLLSIDAVPLLALGSTIALPSPSSIDCDFAEHSCGGPRDAMRLPFERPPE